MDKEGKKLDLLEVIVERERAIDEMAYLERVSHACHPCEFATWVGTGYFCPFPKCFREDPFYQRLKLLQRIRSVKRHGKAEGS